MPAHNTDPTGGEEAENFRTREGLRQLLTRLHHEGAGAWTHDPVAAELMEYTAEKYAALARKHHLDPWEAATAAYDVMLTQAARTARDPWGVITHAVRITCIAEERAQGLLCSVHQARRSHVAGFRDAERFADRENELQWFHPAFRVRDSYDFEDQDEEPRASDQAVTTAESAVEDTIALVTVLGWPAEVARTSVEHIAAALARVGSRRGAFEALRRDHHARALLDLPKESWMVLLRVVLGNPLPGYATTAVGRGVLLRLLLGESLAGLLCDDDLVLSISMAVPGQGGRSR